MVISTILEITVHTFTLIHTINVLQELIELCASLKSMLPLELKTQVVDEVSALECVPDALTLGRHLLLHLLTNVKHLVLVTHSNSSIHMDQELCTQLFKVLGSTSKFSLEYIHLKWVTLVPGMLAEIIHRSPHLISIQVTGDDPASEVLNYLKKNPRPLRSLQLDSCNVTDLEVVQALVKSQEDLTSGGDFNTGDCEPINSSLYHLSVQSPLVTLGGAVVLLQYLHNLQSFQYSCWNSSLPNLLLYLHHRSSNAKPFGLTSMSVWEATDRSLDTLSLCPHLHHLMIEYTDPSLTSMATLRNLSVLTSLTLRLVPENLIVEAVENIGHQLLVLDIESEEYTQTPISWKTIESIQRNCPALQRLEMHHLSIAADPNTFRFNRSRRR